MIRNEEVFRMGYITHPHGLHGEVEMVFYDDCFDTGQAEYLVLEIDGILVPFFWEEYRFKNNDTAIIKFEYIDNEKKARSLSGLAVYYPKALIHSISSEEQETLSSYKALTGFLVSNENGDAIGTVTDVDDSSQNILLTLKRSDDKEVILPFHNDLLIHYDLRERTLQLSIPNELLTLND